MTGFIHIPYYLASLDRKSTRLNSSHGYISYAVFCLKKKTTSPVVTVRVSTVFDAAHTFFACLFRFPSSSSLPTPTPSYAVCPFYDRPDSAYYTVEY